ncbi:17689_t:CDS:1, partial [Racocetra fulgida]
GTQMFYQMNSGDKSAFFASLKNELSQFIPVKLERLNLIKGFQVANRGTSFAEQVQFLLTISDSDDNTER